MNRWAAWVDGTSMESTLMHEDRLLQIMNLFHERVDELESTISQSGQYSQRRAEILSGLKHSICALFL